MKHKNNKYSEKRYAELMQYFPEYSKEDLQLVGENKTDNKHFCFSNDKNCPEICQLNKAIISPELVKIYNKYKILKNVLNQRKVG